MNLPPDGQTAPSPYRTTVSSNSIWYDEEVYNATVGGYTSTLAVYTTDPIGVQGPPFSVPTISPTLTSSLSVPSSTSSVIPSSISSLAETEVLPAAITSFSTVSSTTDVPTPVDTVPQSSTVIASSPSPTASLSATTTLARTPSSTNHISSSSVTASLNPASATTASAPTSTGAQSPTGLYASVGVLATLLVLALIALAILLFKRRNQSHRNNYVVADESKVEEDSPIVIAEMESTISRLQKQLHQKESQLQNSQAALLQQRNPVGESDLDDKQINERFARLSQSINDWVLTHFKSFRNVASPTGEVKSLATQVSSNYSMLLQDPQGKHLVLRGMVAAILLQSFTTGELLGQPAFSELKQLVKAKSTVSESNEWRSLTMRLLEKSPSYRRDQASSVQEISEKIDQTTSNLAGLDNSEARLQHLNQVVEAAAALALDLEKEKMQYKVERPYGRTFDTGSMEDVAQDHIGANLQGKPIQGLVFPCVIKMQGQTQADQGLVIFKAQVII
ncbi:hypothetical protein MMC11_007505 [Xylographa trunciseda]|nr:hypothetical protein [Xylographa trunciseda]